MYDIYAAIYDITASAANINKTVALLKYRYSHSFLDASMSVRVFGGQFTELEELFSKPINVPCHFDIAILYCDKTYLTAYLTDKLTLLIKLTFILW